MKIIEHALELIVRDGWAPPWQIDVDYGWCLHDALLESCGFAARAEDFDQYIQALNTLSEVSGDYVLDWERAPHREEDDVIRILNEAL